MGEQDILLKHIVTHPTIYNIVKLLLKTSGSFISDISEKLGYDRRIVSHHLMSLSDVGLVKTELKETGKKTPVLERYAEPTNRLYNMQTFLSKLSATTKTK